MLNNFSNLDYDSVEVFINLAAALIHLGRINTAEPILRQLDELAANRPWQNWWDGDKIPSRINRGKIQRLLFKGYPDNAIEYLLQLQQDQGYDFSITAGYDLAQSFIGPVSADLARQVLGEADLISLIEILLERMDDKIDQAALRLIYALVPDLPKSEILLNLLSIEIPSQIRYLSAKLLLDTENHDAAITTLEELVQTQPEQAAEAAEILLENKKIADLDLQLLLDIALLTNYDSSTNAILALLKAGFKEIAIPTALCFLTILQIEKQWKRDYMFKTVVEGLIDLGYTEIGLSAAHWLAVFPGFRFRFEMCEALIEAGRIDQAIQALEFLAYECHDEASQRACKKLIRMNKSELVVPLLNYLTHCLNPSLSYQSSFTLALCNEIPSDYDSIVHNHRLRKSDLTEQHIQVYNNTVEYFYQNGLKALDTLEPANDQANLLKILSRLSLNLFAGLFNESDQDIKKLLKCRWPFIILKAIQYDLRIGRVDRAQQNLVTLLTGSHQTLSLPVLLKALTMLGQINGTEITSQLIETLNNKESRIREAAAKALGLQGNSSAVQHLITTLVDENKFVRKAAAKSLGQLGDASAIQPLIKTLNDKENDVRSSAVMALGQLLNSSAMQPLIDALSDNNFRVRLEAIGALRKLENPVAIGPLLTAIKDKNCIVREASIYALGQLGDSSVSQSLLSILQNCDDRIKRRIAFALDELSDPSIIQILINKINDENINMRRSAVEVLGYLGNPSIIQSLITAKEDKDKSLRWAAIQALGRLGDFTVIKQLIAALNDNDINIRYAAACVLKRVGTKEAAQPLILALNDEDSTVRCYAARALGQLNVSHAVHHLIATLSDSDQIVRGSAASSLGFIGHSIAVSPLIVSLNDESNYVRSCASQALGRLGDSNAIRPLITTLVECDKYTRSQVAEALSRLEATETIPIIMANSKYINYSYSYHLKQYARAMIHLSPENGLLLLNLYARPFQRKSWIERLRGHALWLLGDLNEALSNFKKAVEKKDNRDNLLALSSFYLEQDNIQKAEEYVKRAIAKKPWSAFCLLSLAVILWCKDETMKALGKLKQAQQRYRRIANIKDLQYENFWGEKAIKALEEMLAYKKDIDN